MATCLVLFQYCPTPLKGANQTDVGALLLMRCVGSVTAALKLALFSIDVMDSGRVFQSLIVVGVKANFETVFV